MKQKISRLLVILGFGLSFASVQAQTQANPMEQDLMDFLIAHQMNTNGKLSFNYRVNQNHIQNSVAKNQVQNVRQPNVAKPNVVNNGNQNKQIAKLPEKQKQVARSNVGKLPDKQVKSYVDLGKNGKLPVVRVDNLSNLSSNQLLINKNPPKFF